MCKESALILNFKVKDFFLFLYSIRHGKVKGKPNSSLEKWQESFLIV